ncbi:tetratricopeptide repeat protein [Rhodoplanes azumiensis]|uniref:Tetratricopeptide repeat protein n=1 Tax=Rhodoplanes azumiensis TaxID=1897628 RepID=A0ABW5AK60_9BRAD
MTAAATPAAAAPKRGDAQAADRAACSGKDPDASIAACTRLLDGVADAPVSERAIWFNNRGVALNEKGHHDLAIRDFDEAIRLGHRGAFTNRGFAYRRKGDLDQAVRDYSEAIHLDPTRPQAYNNLGVVYRLRGELDRAIREYDEAIRRDPKYTSAYNNRGFALAMKGETDRAMRDFDQAITLDPNYSNAYRHRGDVLARRGDIRAAMRDYDSAIRLDPKYAAAYRGRGELLARIGDVDRALADLDAAIRFDPADPGAYTARGQVLEQKNEASRALSDYRIAVTLPESSEAKAAREKARDRIAALTAAPSATPPAVTAAAPAAATAAVAPAGAAVAPPSAPPKSVAAPTFARRVALVVGNSAYVHAPPLANPQNDAGDVAAALRRIGFDVVEGRNLDRRGMDEAVRSFGRKLDGADLAVFFYAGHGLQVAGKNYLVPVDAKLERPGDLALDAVDVSLVLAQMEADKRVNLVFLDACRDNPLSRSLARSLGTRSATVGTGLASIQSALGTMIAYATQPDNVALDGEGRNSPFTTALLKHIGTPGVDIGTIMRRVRAEVVTATREKQVPWDHSSLIGDVVLVP